MTSGWPVRHLGLRPRKLLRAANDRVGVSTGGAALAAKRRMEQRRKRQGLREEVLMRESSNCWSKSLATPTGLAPLLLRVHAPQPRRSRPPMRQQAAQLGKRMIPLL
jgi:hypothetical protein